MNLAMLLEMVADAAPDRPVVGTHRDGLTAGELRRRVDRAAARIRSSDVDHVAWVGLNSDAYPVALLASATAGRPFAPVNYRLPDDQLAAVLQRLVPCVVVAGDDMADRIRDIEGVTVWSEADLVDLVDGGDEAGDQPGEAPEVGFVDPEEIAVLLFTSGTTGEPKAAILRHRHLFSYVIGSVEFLGSDEADAQLVSVPPYHIAGISSVLSSLYSGRRLVYLPTFDAEQWVRTASEEQVTHAMVVPTMLGRILSLIEDEGVELSSLRHLSYGGGRMPIELIERAMKLLPNVQFVNAYGLTETSSTVSVLTPDDHRAAVDSTDPAVRQRLGSVGRPLDSVELEIRGPDGRALGPGERGEICVRGEQVAGEYIGRRVIDDDGWFPTNDAGYLDTEGFLFLDGRLDDVIVRGAENLSPGEIEDALMSHPGVREAAVVGVPDQEWGEAVAAAVVVDPGQELSAEDLQQWVRQQLRSTKTPERIDFRPELPYSETGKLLRRVIRDELSGPPPET
jgi:acyl-CoA synthetase (AMP-forming)/AMP-acid ligase II